MVQSSHHDRPSVQPPACDLISKTSALVPGLVLKKSGGTNSIIGKLQLAAAYGS
jgi:hypothetical protein